MKASPGIKIALVVLFVVAAASAALAVRLTLALDRLEERATATRNALEELTATVAARDEAPDTMLPSGSGDVQKADLETLMLKLRAVSRRLDALEAGDIEDLGIASLIDRKLGESAAKGLPLGQGFAKMDDIGSKLQMSEAQKKRATDIIDRARAEIVDILHTRDASGRTMAERIALRLKEPGSRANKTENIVSDMFDSNVPGTDESYFTALMNVRQGAIEQFQGSLSQEQLDAFGGMGVDVFAIETGYSPFAAEWQSALSGKP